LPTITKPLFKTPRAVSRPDGDESWKKSDSLPFGEMSMMVEPVPAGSPYC
jgi:hypothetical protein